MSLSVDARPVGEVLGEAVDSIWEVLHVLEPGTLDGPGARRLVEIFARGERLCATGKALCAARVAQTSAWTGGGVRSPEEWFANVSGISLGTATAALGTAERLESQPELTEALRAGELSAAQANEISQAAEAAKDSDPGAAGRLVDHGRSGASFRSLQNRCRQVSASAESAESDRARAAAMHRRRWFKTWCDPDGMGRGSFALAPGAYARFLALFKPFGEQAFDEARRQGRRERGDAYAADGLMAMAEAAHSGRADPEENSEPARSDGPDDHAVHTDASGSADEARKPTDHAAGDSLCDPPPNAESTDAISKDPSPPGVASNDDTGEPLAEGERAGPSEETIGENRSGRSGRVGPPATVIAVVDEAALRRGHAHPGERAEIVGVGSVPVSEIHEMLADAFLAAVVSDGVDIRSVVHLGRKAIALQRTALIVRDGGACVHCASTHRLEIDHVDDWRDTHHTTLDELALLCRRCHHLKSYKHWRLLGRPGSFKLIPPEDDPSP